MHRIVYSKFYKFYYIFLLVFICGHTYSQNIESEFNQIFYNYIGVENNEINNGRSYHTRYRSVDDTHVFLGAYKFYKGRVHYRQEVYKTQLQYDILNDLIIVRHIDENHVFSLSLTPELVNQLEFNHHFFVKLPWEKELNSFYKNGLFESVLQGKTLNFYIKHQKKLLKKLDNKVLQYSFKTDNIYILQHNKRFYEIRKKNDIIKALPQFKRKIKSFYSGKRKIDKKSLWLLFKQLDKSETNESK